MFNSKPYWLIVGNISHHHPDLKYFLHPRYLFSLNEKLKKVLSITILTAW
jgi:hypothetical protein